MTDTEIYDILAGKGVGEETLQILKDKNLLNEGLLAEMSEDDMKEIGIADLLERKRLLAFTSEIKEGKEKAKSTTTIAVVGKSKWVALLLWLLLGFAGAPRLYVGKIGTGITQLVLSLLGFLTFGITTAITGIWLLVDLVLILTGKMTAGASDKVTVEVQ